MSRRAGGGRRASSVMGCRPVGSRTLELTSSVRYTRLIHTVRRSISSGCSGRPAVFCRQRGG